MAASSPASTPSGVMTFTCTPAISRASTVAGMSSALAANPVTIASSMNAMCAFHASASSSGGDIGGCSRRSTTICWPAVITACAWGLTVGGTRMLRSSRRPSETPVSGLLSVMAGTYRVAESLLRGRARAQNPATGCGAYGASSRAISSSDSVSSTAATASLMWCGLVAPMIGAVMPGFDNIHAVAT